MAKLSPKVSQSLYIGGSLVTGVLSLGMIWGGIDTDTAVNLGQVVTGIVTLLGGTAVSSMAAARTSKQRKDGVFDDAPVVHADNAVEGIAAVAQQFNAMVATVTDGVQKVQDAAGGLAGVLTHAPGVTSTPLADAVRQAVAQKDAQS